MMNKKKSKNKRKKQNRKKVRVGPPSFSWQDEEGFHFLAPGKSPSPDQVEEMTKKYQDEIRNSPLWDKILKKFGKEKAEELLKECRVNID